MLSMENMALEGWFKRSYDLNVAALSDLYFTDRQLATEFPSFETVVSSITCEEADFLIGRNNRDHSDHLVIAPTVSGIGLKGRAGLLTRFDMEQPAGKPSFVQAETWGRTDNYSRIHDNGRGWPGFQVAVLLDDEHTSGFEPGLMYTDLTVSEQREQFVAEQAELAAKGLPIEPITIGQYVLANAQFRLAEYDRLDDENTATRFIQYELQPGGMGAPPYSVNTASTWGDRLWLKGSLEGMAKPNEGVRRVLKLNVTTSDAIDAEQASRRASPGLISGVDMSKHRND